MPKKPLSQHPEAIRTRERKKRNPETFLGPARRYAAKFSRTEKGRIANARTKGNYNVLMGAISLEEWAVLLMNAKGHRMADKRNLKKCWHESKIPSDLDHAWILGQLKAGCPRMGYIWREDIIIPAHLRPSLDRIDSDYGYTKDNVQVTCRIYNIAKNEWSDYDLIEAARMMVATADARHGITSSVVDLGIAPMQRHEGRWVHATEV